MFYNKQNQSEDNDGKSGRLCAQGELTSNVQVCVHPNEHPLKTTVPPKWDAAHEPYKISLIAVIIGTRFFFYKKLHFEGQASSFFSKLSISGLEFL